MADLNRDEQVVVQKSTFNVAAIISAIALLLLVLGMLHYFGIAPI